MDVVLVIGIVLLPVVFSGLVVFLVMRRIRQDGLNAMARLDEVRKREAQAIWAGAMVISMQHSMIIEDGVGRARVDVHMNVEPPGGTAYYAKAHWLADLTVLPLLQPGQQVSVKIDQQDPQIIYPNMSGVKSRIA
ncbi:MAG: hypothetical protein JW726_03080 [Anaerolineales bacterium]|nr:hypothetical protein [Anaerolineales bacterium]